MTTGDSMRVGITAEQMAETFGTDGVIRFAAPHPLVRHEPTRSFLSDIGLPSEAALIRFEEAHEAADGLLVIGRFTFYGDRKVYLDGEDGRVYAEGMYSRGKPRLLASDLSVLVTFAGLIEQVRAGGVADGGLDGAESLLDRLLGVLAEYDPEVAAGGREVSSFWPVSFLAWTTVSIVERDPADLGMLVDFDFGTSGGSVFEVADLPGVLTHEPSRRYLQEVGLVGTSGYFEMRGGAIDYFDPKVNALPTLAQKAEEDREEYGDEDYGVELPPEASHLVVIGYAMDDQDIVVDGRDGRVLIWSVSEDPGQLAEFNGDLSTMNFHHWAIAHMNRLGRERPINDLDGFGAQVLGEALAGVDPAAWADRDEQYWPIMLLSPENSMIGF